MKAIAVIPGRPGSVHLARMERPTVAEIEGGRGVLTHPVAGLDSYEQLLGALTNASGAIKVYCQVAPLDD